MRYVIGVEGSETVTTAVVADATGCVMGLFHGPALPPFNEANGCDVARRSLAETVKTAIALADLENANFAAACIGSSADVGAVEALCISAIPATRLLVAPLSRLALASVTMGHPGIVAFAGAGATVCGTNDAGQVVMTGGWGGLTGDEGSAAWIVQRALNACCRATDGTGPDTQMLALLLKQMEITSFRLAFERINGSLFSNVRIAAIMDVVRTAAVQGDAQAQRILRDAGRELGLAVSVTLQRLQMQGTNVMVGTVGEVFQSGRFVLRTFREMVHRSNAQAMIMPMQVPLVVGAAILALNALDIEVTESVEAHLRRTGSATR